MNCLHILTKGINAGSQCKKNRVDESDYCRVHLKMYDKREKTRQRAMDDFSEFNTVRQIEETQPERINKSIFMITINCNKTLENLTENQRNRFKVLMEHLFDKGHIMDFVQSPDNDANEHILQIRTDYNFEIGPINRTVHSHSTLEIDHKTMLRLNIPELRKLTNKLMGSACHINIKTPHQISSKTWERYINKLQI